MRVLLLNPPFTPGFMRSARWEAPSISGSNWYPIWLAYCTGLLEKHGHATRLIDAPVDKLSRDQVVREATVFRPDLTVVYVSTMSLSNDVEVAECVAEATGSYIVLVGPWCSIKPDEILLKSTAIDSLVKGEFDFAILGLAAEIPERDIPGLSWKQGNTIIHNSRGLGVSSQELDQFPFVTEVYRRHLTIENYYQAPHLHPFVDLFTGRGCSWGNCTFCLWPQTITRGSNYRTRSVGNVMQELLSISEKLPNVREVFIQDDTLPDWRARELSLAILKNGVDVVWSCYARPDMGYDTLRLMRDAGCRCVHVGYESSNLQILKNIRKGVTPQMAEKFTEAANRAGLLIHGDFVLGLPGETAQTIEATIKWARKLEIHSYQFTTPKIWPGTAFYDWLEKNGYLEAGELAYSHLSNNELCELAKHAMRACYFQWNYLRRLLPLMGNRNEVRRLMRSSRYVIPNIVTRA
jgi:radical SAM superfamily enzyme YgiQ (UPF0313 family)